MIRDMDADKAHELHLEKAMYSAWLKESGESNNMSIEHLKKCVRVAIQEGLTEKQRQYLLLYLSGNSVSDISEIVGVKRSTVSVTLNRALDNLECRIKYATPRTLYVGKRVRKSLTGIYKHK